MRTGLLRSGIVPRRIMCVLINVDACFDGGVRSVDRLGTLMAFIWWAAPSIGMVLLHQGTIRGLNDLWLSPRL